MRFPDRQFTSIGQLVELLGQDLQDYTGPVWYRGHGRSTWHLEPKLLRTPGQPESHYLNRFKQNAALLLNSRPHNDFHWLFIMQHHGIGTRLLDWTESPLVGLYFALNEQVHTAEEGALWVLLPTVLNAKSNYRPAFEHEIPSFDDDHLTNYLPETIAREQKSSLYPMAAIAPRNSARMQAQQGVFTISHRENIHIENVGQEGAARDHIYRYLVAPGRKEGLLRDLRRLGFNRFQLFPELDSISELV